MQLPPAHDTQTQSRCLMTACGYWKITVEQVSRKTLSQMKLLLPLFHSCIWQSKQLWQRNGSQQKVLKKHESENFLWCVQRGPFHQQQHAPKKQPANTCESLTSLHALPWPASVPVFFSKCWVRLSGRSFLCVFALWHRERLASSAVALANFQWTSTSSKNQPARWEDYLSVTRRSVRESSDMISGDFNASLV